MREIPAALSVAELAKGTGYSQKTVRKLIDQGELPGYATSVGHRCPWAWFDDYQHGRWLPASKKEPPVETPAAPKNVSVIHERKQRKVS